MRPFSPPLFFLFSLPKTSHSTSPTPASLTLHSLYLSSFLAYLLILPSFSSFFAPSTLLLPVSLGSSLYISHSYTVLGS